MTDASRPRRRSDVTKDAILTAAREQFAASGYQAATVRAIAAKAGIDPALVIRYFGTKQNLFALAAKFELRLPDLSVIPKTGAGAALVEHFFDRWEGDDTLIVLLRSAATSEPAARRMRSIFAGQLVPIVTRLTGEPRARAAVRAGLISSQMLGVAFCRYVLKLPAVVRTRRAALVRRLGPTIQHYLFDE